MTDKLRIIGKTLGERLAIQNASVLAAITPDEQQVYQNLGTDSQVHLLPLRALPGLLQPLPAIDDQRPLRVFFMASSYNMPWSRRAFEFIVNRIVPDIRAAAPGEFEFHFLGGKIPAEMHVHTASDLIIDGYVDDLDSHLESMDIALMPVLFGLGMQQKVFGPLCRGFPTLTHPLGLAGYPFEDGVHVLLADDAADFVHQLLRLRDPRLRQSLAEHTAQRSAELFSRERMDERIRAILEAATGSSSENGTT